MKFAPKQTKRNSIFEISERDRLTDSDHYHIDNNEDYGENYGDRLDEDGDDDDDFWYGDNI